MKIGIITQARLGSSRLPGKILKEVNSRPLLAYHIERLLQTKLPVIVATTDIESDSKITSFCEQKNIPFYRGPEQDVLSRFYETAEVHNLDVVIRVTSDCPLIVPELILKGVEQFKKSNRNDIYVSNCQKRSYPRGFDFEIFSFSSLKEAYDKATDSISREHVTPYIFRNTEHLDIVNSKDASDIRITVDTIEDFDLIEKLIKDFQADQLNSEEIINIFRAHPELLDINAHIHQKHT